MTKDKLRKSSLERVEAFVREKRAKSRFPYHKIVWLLSLYDEDKPEDSKISQEDYQFIESCRYRQNERQIPLKEESLCICNKIYERYQKRL